jgi:hypothetical protein
MMHDSVNIAIDQRLVWYRHERCISPVQANGESANPRVRVPPRDRNSSLSGCNDGNRPIADGPDIA